MFPMMGEALLLVMKETLGDDFTPTIEASWKETYAALSGDMIQAQLSHAKK